MPVHQRGRAGNKKGARGRLFSAGLRPAVRSVPIAADDAEQAQQAGEHVVDGQVDRQRRRDVVGLAAGEDAVDVVQDEGREDRDRDHRDRDHHRRDLQEDVRGRGHQQQDHAGEEEFAQAGEILLDGRGERAHGEEDDRRPAERVGDQAAAVLEAQDRHQQAREHQAHEEREREQQHHAHRRILGFLDAVEEPERDAEEDHESDERAAGEEREIHLHADDRAQDRGDHGQREEQVRVTQDFLCIGRNRLLGLPGLGAAAKAAVVVRDRLEFGCHASSLLWELDAEMRLCSKTTKSGRSFKPFCAPKRLPDHRIAKSNEGAGDR